MKTYIGCKQIQAEPMTLGAYNERRGWTIPANEDPANYDEKLGERIALERVRAKVWMLLGFLLQSARHGLLPSPTSA